MGVKRSAREIREMEFAQNNADEAIQRKIDENLELLKMLREVTGKMVEQQKEIESLKAITELAVKGLEEAKIALKWSIEYHIKTCTCHECNTLETVECTLSEIERLSQ